ncbi:MAG: hypothetical protein ABJC12_00700 [Saprospiraceae bacterium]
MRDLYSGTGSALLKNNQYQILARLYDTTYESLCVEYFSTENSFFREWLNDYKHFLIEYQIYDLEYSENLEKEIRGLTNFVSTASLQAVANYLEKCQSIFSFRNNSPKFR